MDIHRTSLTLLDLSNSLTFPLPFNNLYFSLTTLVQPPSLAQLQTCQSFKAEYMCTIQHLQHSLPPVISVVQEGCVKSTIRSTPSWYDHPRHDTVFVALDDSLPGMEGMVVARVQLFFSFNYKRVDYACAYVNWLVHDDDEPDSDTGLWMVSLEEHHGKPTSQVIDVKTIARAAHLIPVFGSSSIPPEVHYYNSLDSYKSFFVNSFIDHHAYEFVKDG